MLHVSRIACCIQRTFPRRTIYFNQLQSELYQWLLASFGENEKELLEKYNLHSERDGDKPVAEADKGVDFGIDNRWPYATYVYAEIRQKYGQRKSLNVFQLMQDGRIGNVCADRR